MSFHILASFKLKETQKDEAVKKLIETSFPGSYFYIMLIASSIIATIGLLLNSPAIIIGSMLVAPFLSPILSLGLGITMSDVTVIKRSAAIIFKATIVAIATSTVVSLFVGIPEIYTAEIFSRVSASLPYLYVAIAAGVAASFSIVREEFYEYIIGIAISVALLPPIATTGIGLAGLDLYVVIGSFQLFIVNLIGIIFSSVIVFSLMGFYVERKKADMEIKKEEVKLQEEKEVKLDS